MNICFLANAASIHTVRWAKYFRSIGNKVTVVSFEPGKIEDISTYVLPKITPQRHTNILLNLLR